MKKTNLFLGIALVVLAFSACEKESSNSEKDSLSEIVGTYSGEFSDDSGLKSGNSGTADVSMTENDQLQIHCYGDVMDTTFIMDAFENGDSVMVCDTGEAFEMQYGHMGNGGNHMMDMHNNQSEWQHHMSDDHEDGDMHYGGFNMTNHTFEYKFRMMDGDSLYYIVFNGSKD
ncbi:hypothetical protein J1N10_20160 [Carboxylicivirga sp. A043]|uniref:hypothetical protein n=1 Tax=Carboxylicivirga litoralis TaxID=2816963 RepID=UPI0021CB17E1|nr:hypothetical protein [Carboxylicivirga sp. A043]MCU4158299.1 hypothetical protein [Carboxylicivirga sp. A043]